MKFLATTIHGARVIEPELRGDERGFFARIFCQHEFTAEGLERDFVQVNNSLTETKATLRGLHYQLPPASEVKLVRCVRGALYDVILDLRPDSPSFRRWFGIELTADNRRMLYVPRGVAHGFLTLADDTEAFYLVSAFYDKGAERGIRYDDPSFDIVWPLAPVEISAKDRAWPSYDPAFHCENLLRGIVVSDTAQMPIR